ncbi:hypothetical protein [Flavobacterium tegetincola]|uniref:hypothetical protein n=1 Tax=Flavobacterium tegetincola TaxID=150172 RepID=UPI000479BF58|nr:hypothetical protein [Flavobacterium tegetincola]
MKKIIFAIGFMAFSFSAAAQCNAQSTQVNTSCGQSYCVTVKMQLTGFMEVDNGLMDSSGGTMYRKPNARELINSFNQLEALCD